MAPLFCDRRLAYALRHRQEAKALALLPHVPLKRNRKYPYYEAHGWVLEAMEEGQFEVVQALMDRLYGPAESPEARARYQAFASEHRSFAQEMVTQCVYWYRRAQQHETTLAHAMAGARVVHRLVQMGLNLDVRVHVSRVCVDRTLREYLHETHPQCLEQAVAMQRAAQLTEALPVAHEKAPMRSRARL